MALRISLHGSKVSLNDFRRSLHEFRVSLHDSRVIFMAQGEPPKFFKENTKLGIHPTQSLDCIKH
jgi:hypothetical protein